LRVLTFDEKSLSFMDRTKKRTYVSATLDIFIQCRSNWVFRKRIWKRQSISTWACEWSVL